jgi:putative DNA primase/helicase
MAGHLPVDDRGLSRLAGPSPYPPGVVDATEDYFSAQDIFGQWLDEKCDAEPGNGYKTESNATLYASWREYAEKAGEPAGSQKAFAEQMQRRGLQRYRNSAGRGFSGIRLKSPHRSYHDT